VSAIDTAAARAVNHVLRTSPLAMQRLAPHAGRTARFEVGPLRADVTVQTTGEVTAAIPGANADVTLRIAPPLLPRLAAREARAFDEISVAGDEALGRDIVFVAANLGWDVEEDLSKVVGDIAAHRAVEAARAFHHWSRDAATRLAQGAAEYWTEESPLIASRVKVTSFGDEVAQLRDAVDRLAQRIARLG
jgi:ubiquinone biosynthesis protein UbiJ